jgi:hypothetical protein
MGEQSALGESIVSNMGAPTFLHRYDYPSFAENTGCLHIFHADTLKYIHPNALCYNKCKPNATPEEALTIKTGRGERNA